MGPIWVGAGGANRFECASAAPPLENSDETNMTNVVHLGTPKTRLIDALDRSEVRSGIVIWQEPSGKVSAWVEGMDLVELLGVLEITKAAVLDE